jgi:hypothetical protein
MLKFILGVIIFCTILTLPAIIPYIMINFFNY